jgi:hypothetical protein
MKETDWENGQIKGGPQDILDNLIRSGYPWHGLGLRLKEIDQQFQSVTNEYALIHDSIHKLSNDVNVIRERQADTPNTVRNVLREEAGSLQNRWLIAAASMVGAFIGLFLMLSSNSTVSQFIKSNGALIGFGIILIAAFAIIFISRRK